MTQTIQKILDSLCMIGGIALITLALLGMNTADAASLTLVSAMQSQYQAVLAMGILLLTAPLTRRSLGPVLMGNSSLRECKDVADAVSRLGLQQRVQAVNVYFNSLDDSSITRAFGGADGLADWIRPACQDPELARQIDPAVMRRIQHLTATIRF